GPCMPELLFLQTIPARPATAVPRLAPSSLNWTPTTPTLSEWVFETRIVPATVAPGSGEEMEMVGGVLSTVTLTAAEVAVFPAASRGTAVSVWYPYRAMVEVH